MNFLGEIEELEFASGIAHGGKAANELSDAGAVDIVNTGEVEDDLLLARGDESADGIAKIADFVAENDSAMNIKDGDVSDFAGVNLQRTWFGRILGRWPEW